MIRLAFMKLVRFSLDEEEDGLPKEVEHVAAVITGKWVDHAWQAETKDS